jgi:hypothetical protein
MTENAKPEATVIKIKKPSFSEKFKSKNAPSISGVETLLTVLPIIKIGDVGDWTRLHPSEDNYWLCELCFVSVPIKGAKRDMLHLIDDDLAVQYLSAKKIIRHRLALACKPHDVFFFCVVPSQNLDNAWNRDALTACCQAQTHWIQALSRRSGALRSDRNTKLAGGCSRRNARNSRSSSPCRPWMPAVPFLARRIWMAAASRSICCQRRSTS